MEPKSNEDFIDATLGLGGHAQEILKLTSPNGRVLGIDQDEEAISLAKKNLEKYGDRLVAVKGNFAEIEKIAAEYNFLKPKGILFDLGMNSWQIEKAGRGFSFMKNESLDMRFNDWGVTAAEILNRWSVKDLAKIFWDYGDIKKNWILAKKIVHGRERGKIENTENLIKIIGTENPKILAPIFQAIRIVVNDEYRNFERGLEGAAKISEKIIVISFHSGEDRIVKNFFRDFSIPLTKKPIIASEEEIAQNSRARSAKLRAGETYAKTFN